MHYCYFNLEVNCSISVIISLICRDGPVFTYHDFFKLTLRFHIYLTLYVDNNTSNEYDLMRVLIDVAIFFTL